MTRIRIFTVADMRLCWLILAFSLCAGSIQAQTVSGVVTDDMTGSPLPGVNIVVQGTTTGTASGRDGEFQLAVPSLNDTLMFSFVGYQTRAVPINGRQTIERNAGF